MSPRVAAAVAGAIVLAASVASAGPVAALGVGGGALFLTTRLRNRAPGG